MTSVLVSRGARHGDRIYHTEVDHDSVREEIRLLKDKVQELEQGREFDEMMILHAYEHLEETHSQIQLQRIVIDRLEHRLDEMKYRAMMVGYLHHQMAQLVVLVVVYFGLWWIAELGKLRTIILGLEEGKIG